MQTEPANRYRDADLASGREASILARALELAAEAAGNDVSAEDAWRATSDYAADVTDWTTVAISASHALGLQPHLRSGGPAGLTRNRPAMVRVGEGQWMVVVASRGRKWRVVQLDERGETRMTMSASQLEVLAEGQAWLHLQPLLALDPIATHRRPGVAKHPWLRLRAFLSLEKRELWVVVVYAIVVGALTLATPVAVQALVNIVAFGSLLQPLVVLSMLLMAGLAFSAVLSVLEAYVVEVLQRRVFVRVADDFGRRLPTLRTEVFDEKNGPELVNRFFDVLTIQKSMASLLLDGLAVALQTAIGMILLGFYHPVLLAFDVVLTVLLVIVLLMGRGAVATGFEESSAKYRTVAWLEDVVRVSRLYRGASAQRTAAMQTEMLCRNYLTARRGHFRILLRQIAGGMGLQVFTMVALLGVGGWLVIARELTLGQLVAAELVIAAIGAGFVKLGKHLEKIYDLNVGVLKISKIVDLPTERRGGEPLPTGGPMGLTLRGVSMVRGGHALLHDASLEVAPGERLRLSGDVGVGKSTLIDAMAALRSVTSGSVQVDGLDLRRADLAQARDQISLVRGAEFVEGSVLENIRFSGFSCHGEAPLRELLCLVELEDVIDRLPEGVATPMLPSGSPLSTRQARRLALVRALAARPRLLLLDGALDGLGMTPSGQQALLDAVMGPHATWTVVVITDEPAVAERCTTAVHLSDRALEVMS